MESSSATASINRVKAELRSKRDIPRQKGDLSGHKLFLEALLNPRAVSDLTSYVNSPSISSLFLTLLSGTSAVSGYLFKWAFFTWSGFGLVLVKKKKELFQNNKKKLRKKTSVWQKSQNSSLKTHRAALFWKCQFCEILGSPCRALSALSSQDSACNLKLLRRLRDQATSC